MGSETVSSAVVRVDDLRAGGSPRLTSPDPARVRELADSAKPWPPILVHAPTMRVLDGAHRVAAARLLGHTGIEAVLHFGTEDEAFVAAVRANLPHGLPLADRTAAAERIMRAYPEWSDRRIASVTGLAGTTVGAVRRCSGDQDVQTAVRVGRDGRARPLDNAANRKLASELLAENPGASLREIARAAGIAPSTVRDVRERMRSGEDPVARRRRGESRPAPVRTPVQDRATALRQLSRDPSLRFTESGRTLLRLLETQNTRIGEWQRVLDEVPPHCATTVADLVRDTVRQWGELASRLERRAEYRR
ncbi:transposase-like protein [Crossiella equi]|uniref:Transposase-like protein n=1 Tax=Crossiella equi TaxID=130796 RepID=A0ABS5ABN0_9PSEU|nr:helix-turn-helix domain-containing protein [Crossiella equi]MBP2473984.1 transposase-like protein [Crossiella equi]